MFKRFTLSLFLLLCLIPFNLYAQDAPDWFVYAYNSLDQQLTRIHHDGATETIALPLSENVFLSASEMSIDNSGNHVAFCEMVTDNAGNTTGTVKWVDLSQSSTQTVAEYSEVGGCRVSSFSADASQIAVSTVTNMPQMDGTPNVNGQPVWRVQIVRIADGEIVHELNAADDIAPAFDQFGVGVPMMADVQVFTDEAITFMGIPWVGMGGPSQLPAYTWNWDSNTLTEASLFGRVGDDFLAESGELVYPVWDDSRPYAEPIGPMASANQLHVTNDNGTRVIYENSEWVITSASFVNNGSQIMITLLGGISPSNPQPVEPIPVRYELLNRDGTVLSVGEPYTSYTQVGAIPGGTAILWVDHNPMGDGTAIPTYHLDEYNDSVLQTIWQEQPDANSQGFSFPELVWTPPVQVTETLMPFPAVN